MAGTSMTRVADEVAVPPGPAEGAGGGASVRPEPQPARARRTASPVSGLRAIDMRCIGFSITVVRAGCARGRMIA